MTRIGLIGEDPNDTQSIKNLLGRKYVNLHFQLMLRGVRGHQLDNAKTGRAIAHEIKTAQCKLIIFIRDLDGAESQGGLLRNKNDWFKKFANSNDVLMLNIWELEALIFADIETFNKIYDCKINFIGDPMGIAHPKDKLKLKTEKRRKKYHESHAPDIFKLLRFDYLIKNCRYFKEFLLDFEQKVGS